MIGVPVIREALTFDDVLLCPAESQILLAETDVSTRLTRGISLKIPLISAAMDSVTQSAMAIAMAQAGGLGVIHRNLSPDNQADQVRTVKKFVSGMVVNPVTCAPDDTLGAALALMAHHRISGIPVIDPQTGGRLVGILTNRDVRFAEDKNTPVSDLMTKELITLPEGGDLSEAKRLFHQHRIEKLPVIDQDGCCVGLVTVKDIEKARLHPSACKDDQGSLRVGAATSTGSEGVERAAQLAEAGCDVIIVDTAHGHSRRVIEAVREIRQSHNEIQIVAGNVATAEGAKSLIDAGADGIKIGIGPGSICTTRMVAGVGVPQLTAIMDAAKVAQDADVPIIADGGIKYSGDFAKAIAAGASCAMIGTLLAGTEETPGEVFLYRGRSYKSYRGMGSLGAMADGSADRYAQGHVKEPFKLVPEGVEGRVPYKGPVADVLHQLIGGLRAAMGYTGCATIQQMQTQTNFVKMSPAGLRESHVHSVMITREAPNYPGADLWVGD